MEHDKSPNSGESTFLKNPVLKRVCWQNEKVTELVMKQESTLAWLFGDGEN